jgi:serine/threonine protein phosphatase 1
MFDATDPGLPGNDARTDSMRLVRWLPCNRRGHDYVVGDLHGCCGLLYELLDAVRFDPAADRLLAVGDLADRGPDSMGGLALLKEPWCHAVMGNHEQMLLDYFRPLFQPFFEETAGLALDFLANGGEWVLQECDELGHPSEKLAELLRRVAGLPQFMVVGRGTERYHLVHADFFRSAGPAGIPRLWTDAELDTFPEFAPPGTDYPGFRWSREIMTLRHRSDAAFPDRVECLSTTFCGHTIAPAVRKILSHVCLDTGAFLTCRNPSAALIYGLTLANVADKRCLTLREPGGPIESCAL